MSAFDKYDNKRGLDDVYSGRHLLWTDIQDNVSPSWLTPYKHDASSQGQYLKKRLRSNVNLDRIQKSSGDWVGAKIEGFENGNEEKNVDAMVNAIRISQQQFDAIYQQYEAAYQRYNQNRQQKIAYMKQHQRYLGKLVIRFDSTKYYVNKYGYARLLDTSQGTPLGCPDNTAIPIALTQGQDEDFSNGIKLGQHQTGVPCDLEGKVVYKEETIDGQPQRMYGWMDETGKMSPLPNDTRCNLIGAIKLNSDVYDKIPKGSQLSTDDSCSIMADNSWRDLMALNKQLTDKATTIEQQLNELSQHEEAYGQVVARSSVELVTKRNQLAQHRQRMNDRLQSVRRLEGEISDSGALYRSEHLKFLGLTGLTVGLGGYLLYRWMS
jgi:hypothetical protein